MQLIELRVSGLPGAVNCWRQWAADSGASTKGMLGIRDLVKAKGFSPRDRKSGQHVGNGVGTSLHHGFNEMWTTGADPTEKSLGKWSELLKEGIEFDPRSTPNDDVARTQIQRMAQAYLPIAQKLKPIKTEFTLTRRIDDQKPYIVTGHPDLLNEDGRIIDMKFGKNSSSYEAQLGGYSLISRAEGMDVTGVEVHHTPRSARTKPQVPTEIIKYGHRVAEVAATRIIEEAVSRVEKFQETGDPWAFTPNNNSTLCSKKWCPAWGTDFCDMGKPEKQSED